MERLHFAETLSVGDSKAQQKVEKIEVKQNLQIGKCFFVYGVQTGAVSDKFLNGGITSPVISQVCLPETGDMFYLLHKEGDGGAPILAVCCKT